MAQIHLMVGFMGFGKTTAAKKLAQQLPAVLLTHDNFMVKLYHRDIKCEEFTQKYNIVDKFIWEMAEQTVKSGINVILDYGFWTKEKRQEAYQKAKTLGAEVIFHELICSQNVAKKRVLKRTAEDKSAFDIDENCFNKFYQTYEPIQKEEGYRVIRHKGA